MRLICLLILDVVPAVSRTLVRTPAMLTSMMVRRWSKELLTSLCVLLALPTPIMNRTTLDLVLELLLLVSFSLQFIEDWVLGQLDPSRLPKTARSRCQQQHVSQLVLRVRVQPG